MPQTTISRSASARDRITLEHHRLSAQLDLIELTTDPARLPAALERLHVLLDEHFPGEEASDGLHEAIGGATPHLLPAVQHLFDEHRDFLADLHSLTARARWLAAGPLAELRAGLAGLTARLRDHEARENDLFGESVYTDVGSQD
jgi:hypothetical protein